MFSANGETLFCVRSSLSYNLPSRENSKVSQFLEKLTVGHMNDPGSLSNIGSYQFSSNFAGQVSPKEDKISEWFSQKSDKNIPLFRLKRLVYLLALWNRHSCFFYIRVKVRGTRNKRYISDFPAASLTQVENALEIPNFKILKVHPNGETIFFWTARDEIGFDRVRSSRTKMEGCASSFGDQHLYRVRV